MADHTIICQCLCGCRSHDTVLPVGASAYRCSYRFDGVAECRAVKVSDLGDDFIHYRDQPCECNTQPLRRCSNRSGVGLLHGAPQQVKVPNLQPVKAPPTNVEYIRAWSPIIGMAIPLLWGAVWSSNSGSSGTTISAAEGSNVILDSGNPGSYNSVGGDYGMDLIQTDYSLVNQNNDNCATGECDENGGIILPEGGDCSLGGVINPATGKAYTDSSYTCSCSSFEAGKCT